MAVNNQFWWPNRLDLKGLRHNEGTPNPFGADFDYAKEFSTLDLTAVKKDLHSLMTDSQPWWPADYGHYGPFFIRMAWHSAGTYRIWDGRGGAGGGQQRFEPLNSWPDNGNLDKARRLLWPIKAKYGRKLSWADLMILAGNVAFESMGLPMLGFAGGRIDQWEPDMAYWGPEKTWLAGERRDNKGKLEEPLAAVQMGLIYVNPQGPNDNHDPVSAGHDIRESFGLMAMNDEETAALIIGGHSFGKGHGAAPPSCVGVEPAGAPIEAQGFGWANNCTGKGNAENTMTSGLEGAWSPTPTKWSPNYLNNLFKYEWKQHKTPAGATVWVPTTDGATQVPDAHINGKTHPPIMYTTDLALKFDPAYKKVAERFRDNPKELEVAFAKAWYKLTHRDMGPIARYLGPEVPKEHFVWQDPIPPVDHALVDANDTAALKSKIIGSGLTCPDLVRTAWAAAASYRNTDKRGGPNGGRLLLAPQNNWAVNDPAQLKQVLAKLQSVQQEFNSANAGKKKVSMADLIVLGGVAAVEEAARQAGTPVAVPFNPGRMDASPAQTDVESFAVLEPKSDGFRNYYGPSETRDAVDAFVDKAGLLSLTVGETTVLVGGLRALGANAGGSNVGVFTDRPGVLTNDFFRNLLDMRYEWAKKGDNLYEGRERGTGTPKFQASAVDLVFGSNAELRAVAEAYASSDSAAQFAADFARAWAKVMDLDRFDLRRSKL